MGLEAYEALIDDAFGDALLNLRQNRVAAILSEAHRHFTRKELQELESYVF